MQKGITFKGGQKGEAKPTGQAPLGYCKAAAMLLHAAAARVSKRVSQQPGKDVGIIWFPNGGKPGTLVRIMQITVEQEGGTLTHMPDYEAINNKVQSCSLEPVARENVWSQEGFVIPAAGSQALCSQAHPMQLYFTREWDCG